MHSRDINGRPGVRGLVLVAACTVAIVGCGGSADEPSTSSTASSSAASADTGLDAADLLKATIGPAPDSSGALVRSVSAGGASRLRRGDVITAVNGEDVSSADELVAAVGTVEIAAKYRIRVVRGDRELSLVEQVFPTAYLGVKGRDAHGSGIEVLTVGKGSPADDAGVRGGDTITAVDGDPVDSVDELLQALGQAGSRSTVALTVERGSDELTLEATLAERPG